MGGQDRAGLATMAYTLNTLVWPSLAACVLPLQYIRTDTPSEVRKHLRTRTCAARSALARLRARSFSHRLVSAWRCRDSSSSCSACRPSSLEVELDLEGLGGPCVLHADCMKCTVRHLCQVPGRFYCNLGQCTPFLPPLRGTPVHRWQRLRVDLVRLDL